MDSFLGLSETFVYIQSLTTPNITTRNIVLRLDEAWEKHAEEGQIQNIATQTYYYYYLQSKIVHLIYDFIQYFTPARRILKH